MLGPAVTDHARIPLGHALSTHVETAIYQRPPKPVKRILSLRTSEHVHFHTDATYSSIQMREPQKGG